MGSKKKNLRKKAEAITIEVTPPEEGEAFEGDGQEEQEEGGGGVDEEDQSEIKEVRLC